MEDLSGVNITLVKTTEQLLDFLRWLSQSRSVLAIDTETGGLDRWRDKLRLIQLGDRDCAWCFDAEGWTGLIKDVLSRYDGPMVLHNAKFDIHFLERFMPWTPDMWRRTHDTAVMAHLIDPVSSRALKTLTQRFIHPKAAMAQQQLVMAMNAQKWGRDDIPVDFPAYWFYGGLDTVLTARLYDYLLPRQHMSLYELEQKTLWSTFKMEKRGLHIDLPFCKHKREELLRYVQEAKQYVLNTWGVENVNSNMQLIAKFQELGVNLTKMTASGASLSMDKEVLMAIDHPMANIVLDIRKAEKIVGTYLDNFIADHDHSIYHADINTLGTRTGRMTAGIMQTLKRGKGPVRDSFTSRHEGGKMILVDYDQLEMRLIAILSNDHTLLHDLQVEDFFTTFTQRVYRDDTIGKKDERRQRTKNARYARNYGAGSTKIALTNGIPIDEVEMIEAQWSESYPQAAAYARHVENIARENKVLHGEAFITTPYGRKEPAKKQDEFYQLINYEVQGFAADLFKEAIVKCDEAGLDEFFVMPIHDEMAFDAPGDIAEDVCRTAQATMMNTDYAIALTTGGDIVDRWGDKYA